MTRFIDYATKYQTIRMERRDGILQMTFHTDGGPLQWGLLPHGEFPQAFRDVGADPENKVVILTGTGDVFSGPRAAGGTGMRSTPAQWDRVYWEGKHLLMSLLDIEVPMISAINGPAWRHSEIPLLCDIVLAADDVRFQDSAHFPNGMVPGDGMHIIYPLLLGWNRGRYFLLTGQILDAAKALELGLVSELLPRPDLLPRAWALAEQIARQPALLLRYTRVLFTQPLKKQLVDYLGYGLALEGLSVVDRTVTRVHDHHRVERSGSFLPRGQPVPRPAVPGPFGMRRRGPFHMAARGLLPQGREGAHGTDDEPGPAIQQPGRHRDPVARGPEALAGGVRLLGVHGPPRRPA